MLSHTDDATKDHTADPQSAPTLSAELQTSVEQYAAHLKRDLLTPRQWLKRNPHLPISEQLREQLWRHYCLAYPPPNVPGFDIRDVLGEGGMGRVYLALDKSLKRLTAIKEVTGEMRRDGRFRARFRLEAEILAKLKDPHIVEIHQFLDQDGHEFMVMEYVEEGSLSERLPPGRPVAADIAVAWISQLARAIGHAHDQGIIHRDLKPGNILFDRNGAPKISDFGLAKNLLDPTDRTHGMPIGTARYMAPEQIDGEPPVPGTDIWALGVIFYRLLTGRLPFDGKTQKELANNICSANPPDMGAAVPPALQAICLKCLEKRPEDRFQRAQDLAVALEAYPPDDPSATISYGISLRSRRRRGWLAATGGVLVVGLVALAAVFMRHGGDPGPQRMKDVHTGHCSSIVFAPAGLRAYSENGGIEIYVWDLKRGIREDTFRHAPGDPLPDEAGLVAVSPNGKWLASAPLLKSILGDNMVLNVLDASTGKQRGKTPVNFKMAPCVAFSPDSAVVASMELGPELLGFRKPDMKLKSFDIEKNETRTSRTIDARGTSLGFAPDGKTLALGCADGTIRLWNTDAKKVDRVFDAHGGAVCQVAFDAAGKRIFSASAADRSLKTWDAASGASLIQISLQENAKMLCTAFWPGGGAVTGHKDGLLLVWDLATGAPIYRFQQPQTEITAAALSPDGRLALSALSDRSVWLHHLPVIAGNQSK